MSVFLPYRSIDDLLGAEAQEGLLKWSWNARTTPGTTAATLTTGGNSWMRPVEQYIVPTLGPNVAGLYCSHAKAYNVAQGQALLAWETLLGSCSRAGGTDTFTPGSAMPTGRWAGNPTGGQQFISNHTKLYVSTTFTGSVGATCDVEYTNELGTGGRHAVVTLGSNPIVGSAYDLTPHLQGADIGILSVQNITFSGGTTSAVRVYGILPLALHHCLSGGSGGPGQFMQPVPQPLLQAGAHIGLYRGNATLSGSAKFTAFFTPETI